MKKKKDPTPYEDATLDAPLLAIVPEPGEIVAKRTIEAAGIIEWTLSNRRPRPPQADGFQGGRDPFQGHERRRRLARRDQNLIPANTADQVVASGGLGGFSAVNLQKKLAGKAAFVRPTIGELEEGLSGSASPKDAETLFQLIYMTFTEPRADPVVFEVLRASSRPTWRIVPRARKPSSRTRCGRRCKGTSPGSGP